MENKREDSIVPIYVYSQAKDTVASNVAFMFVPNMLSYFSYHFGNYPFESGSRRNDRKEVFYIFLKENKIIFNIFRKKCNKIDFELSYSYMKMQK
ncbi:MAG: hypothetical protein ABFD61_03415 [Chloroherpetonaceae bacterium]